MVDQNVQLEEIKRNIKDEIKLLINNGDIENAEPLVREYENIVKDDIEIVNIKAVLRMLQGEIHRAGVILWQAVEQNIANAETFYNLAYTKECEGEYSSAFRFYQKALQLTKETQLVQETETALQQLEPHLSVSSDTNIKRFIILSSCNWGIMLQRPHHIATALARFGHIVDYVEPGRQKATASNAEVTVAEAVAFSKKKASKQGLIQIYSPISISYESQFTIDNYKSLVQDLLSSADEEVVIICYLPNAIVTLEELQGEFKVIYECVDDHTDLEYSFWNSKRDREYEMRLVDRADFITATSSALYLSRGFRRNNIYLSKNGVNQDDFKQEAEVDVPEDLKTIPGPMVCYMGAVYSRFDEKLFYEVVRSNRDLSFVVIGPIMEGMLETRESNLYLLGPKKHSELKKYLVHMKVGIVPFRDDADMIVSCDPIKSYEYISCGLPIVATNMPELAVGKDFIKISANVEGFNQAIRESLVIKLSEEEIRQFLDANSWQARGRQILDILCGNDSTYRKELVFSRLREMWETFAINARNPLLQAIYSLTFAEVDPLKYLELARAAYQKLKTSFTLKCYVFAALLNDETEECVTEVINDPTVDDLLKAELLFLQKLGHPELIRIQMVYLTKQYELVLPEILKLQKQEQSLELGHYYYEMADYDKAENVYSQFLNTGSEYLKSPMLNWNLADLLLQRGALHESQFFHSIAKDSIMQNLEQDGGRIGKARDKRTRFSVVIPTRNSHDTLEFTLKTCLNQSFENYEIVVSDNSNNTLTKELIDRLADRKIKYVKPEQELSMTENFNFAVSHANGEYIMVLGSDDGLLFHAISVLDTILDSFKTRLLSWNLIAYGWPDVALEGYQNYLGIPSAIPGKIGHQYLEGVEIIKAVAQFEVPYNILPMLYCNSVVHTDLLTELVNKTGSVFKSLSPDIYSGFVLAYLQNKYITIDIPISIGGNSGNSNGISYIYGKDKKSEKIRNDYLSLNNKSGLYWNDMIPNVKILETAVADSFICARDALFPHNKGILLNKKKLLEKCVEAIVGIDNKNTERLYSLYYSLEKDTELAEWFYQTYLENPDGFSVDKREQKFVYKRGFINNGSGLILNAMDFGVKDVYGAAELFRKVTGW